jgi:hypothetical protein
MLSKVKNHNIMDTSALAAQLIGEEPRFDVALQTAFQTVKTTVSLYDCV